MQIRDWARNYLGAWICINSVPHDVDYEDHLRKEEEYFECKQHFHLLLHSCFIL